MASLLPQLWQLCLLRIGPQDLPYSPALSRALVVAALAAGLLNAAAADALGEHLLPRLLVTLAFLVAVPWLLLRLRGYGNRLAQTVAAIAGSSLLYALAFLPLSLLTADFDPAEPLPAQVLAGWIGLFLTGWKLAINAHIWRHALGLPFAAAVLLAVGLLLVQVGLGRLLEGAA
ncbi:hypothetical protein [Rehaibacterium terrae]|uniref:Yip1 domain-containing protein n=1 Tax=Rehaibacterium terrae TaxID=1341696 RepID=A0A7W7Y229_9GAMM|nr:hypothetical protein [Rehaibacterium terrae]MBB5016640.1 hypothetical protein [Rehaibacterium terrae]